MRLDFNSMQPTYSTQWVAPSRGIMKGKSEPEPGTTNSPAMTTKAFEDQNSEVTILLKHQATNLGHTNHDTIRLYQKLIS